LSSFIVSSGAEPQSELAAVGSNWGFIDPLASLRRFPLLSWLLSIDFVLLFLSEKCIQQWGRGTSND